MAIHFLERKALDQKALDQKALDQTALDQTALDQALSGVAPAKIVLTREVIQYGGRQFSCTPEMARIFLKHAREVIESGETQLVPLLHSGGIELLLISVAIPYSLVDAEPRPAVAS